MQYATLGLLAALFAAAMVIYGEIRVLRQQLAQTNMLLDTIMRSKTGN